MIGCPEQSRNAEIHLKYAGTKRQLALAKVISGEVLVGLQGEVICERLTMPVM
jgi:hypothetical protein